MLIVQSKGFHCDISMHAYSVLWSCSPSILFFFFLHTRVWTQSSVPISYHHWNDRCTLPSYWLRWCLTNFFAWSCHLPDLSLWSTFDYGCEPPTLIHPLIFFLIPLSPFHLLFYLLSSLPFFMTLFFCLFVCLFVFVSLNFYKWWKTIFVGLIYFT
jgi:hypothetical protein